MLVTLELRKTKLLSQIKKLKSQMESLVGSEKIGLAKYDYHNNTVNFSSDRLEKDRRKQVLLEDYVLAIDHSILNR